MALFLDTFRPPFDATRRTFFSKPRQHLRTCSRKAWPFVSFAMAIEVPFFNLSIDLTSLPRTASFAALFAKMSMGG